MGCEQGFEEVGATCLIVLSGNFTISPEQFLLS